MERAHLRLPKRRAKTLRNQSTETAALIILEFLYDRNLAGGTPPTAHFIQQHAKKLRTTQLSRVQETLGFLEQSGWLEHAESTGGTSYTLTVAGEDFWVKVGQKALSAFAPLYPKLSVNR
jgi:hypothetical protein